MRKRNDVGTTHMKENVVQRKQYPSPPTGDVTFRKKEKERARSALEVFREERRMQQRRSEAFKLRRTRAYELAKEARTANIRNLNAKSNSSTKPEAKVHAERFINDVEIDTTSCSQDLNLMDRHASGSSSHLQSKKKRSCGQWRSSSSSAAHLSREGQPNRDHQIEYEHDEEEFIHATPKNVVASSVLDVENVPARAQSSTKSKSGGSRVTKSSSASAAAPMTALRLSSKQLKQVTDNLATAARNRITIKNKSACRHVQAAESKCETTTVRDHEPSLDVTPTGSNSKLGYSSSSSPSTCCSSSSLLKSTDTFTQRNGDRIHAIWESLDRLKPRLDKLADQIPFVLSNVADLVIATPETATPETATPETITPKTAIPENIVNSEVVVGGATLRTESAASPHLNLNLNLNLSETVNQCCNTLPGGIDGENQSLIYKEGVKEVEVGQHLPTSTEEHSFIKPLSSPEVQYLPMAKEHYCAKSQNSHEAMMALEPISPVRLQSAINDEPEIKNHHCIIPVRGVGSSITTVPNNDENVKKKHIHRSEVEVEEAQIHKVQDQVENDECFADKDKQMVDTTWAAKQHNLQQDMPHENSSSADSVEAKKDPVSNADRASDENNNNNNSFVSADDSFFSGRQHKSTPSYPNLHEIRSPATVCSELQFTTPEARVYDAVPIGNVCNRFSSFPTLIEGCKSHNCHITRHQQFMYTAAARSRTSQPCLCSTVACQELNTNKVPWYEPRLRQGCSYFQLGADLKLRSNHPTVLCETSQICEQQSIPFLKHKHMHNHVEEEGKDLLSVYHIFARAILQRSGQLKGQDQSDERQQPFGGCLKTREGGSKSDENDDELKKHMQKAPLPDFQDNDADETSIKNGGKTYINETSSNAVALDPEFEERNENLIFGMHIARANANSEQEWENTAEFDETSDSPKQLLQQQAVDDADIPVTASLRSRCRHDRNFSRLTAEALKNRFIAQLNVQNNILEHERKLTALMHARELNLAQQSVYKVVQQHWSDNKKDVKTLINEMANEERLKQRNDAHKRELELVKAEYEKQLKASENNRHVTISLATEALTAANRPLSTNVNRLGQSCVPHLGDDKHEQEELELPSILHDFKFTAADPENRFLNEKIEHCGVNLDVTNSLTDAAAAGAGKEEKIVVVETSSPKTIENIVKKCHSKEEEKEPDQNMLMEYAAPLSIASWICPKESCTQDDSSIDNDTFASESGIDSDARDTMLEVQAEREASAQVIGRFILGAVDRWRSKIALLNRVPCDKALLNDKPKPPGGDNEIINLALLNNEGFASSDDRGVDDIAVRVEWQPPILAEFTKEEISLLISEKESISSYSDDTWYTYGSV